MQKICVNDIPIKYLKNTIKVQKPVDSVKLKSLETKTQISESYVVMPITKNK